MAATLDIATAGRGRASQPVVDAIRQASASTGVDFAYLMDKAAAESGYDPSAKAAGSSATGLYQFTRSTWLDMVEAHGAQHGLAAEAQSLADGTASAAATQRILALRTDPTLSAAMAAEYTKDNRQSLQAQLGRPVGSGEMSLAHFLGAGGAGTFLKAMAQNPNQAADQVSPDAAAANPSIFYDKAGQPRSLADVYAKLSGGAASSLPAGAGAATGARGGGPITLAQITGDARASYFTTMILAQLDAGSRQHAALALAA